MNIKINLNEQVKFKLTDFGKDIYYHQFDDLNERIIKNGGKPIVPHFPKEDENGYCEMQLWALMNLYGNYMILGQQDIFKPLEIVYKTSNEDSKHVRCKNCKFSRPLDRTKSPEKYYRDDCVVCECEDVVGDEPMIYPSIHYCGFGRSK